MAERHLRRVGKDCLVSFQGSMYSTPAGRIRAGQRVEVRAGADTITIHALAGGDGAVGELLATHLRAAASGSWVIDPAHWDGLPDGHTRATTIDPPGPGRPTGVTPTAGEANPLAALLAATAAAATPVARRPLSDYDDAALAGTTTTIKEQ